jgi:hypothetical protein
MTLCIYLWDVLYAIATDRGTITMVQGFGFSMKIRGFTSRLLSGEEGRQQEEEHRPLGWLGDPVRALILHCLDVPSASPIVILNSTVDLGNVGATAGTAGQKAAVSTKQICVWRHRPGQQNRGISSCWGDCGADLQEGISSGASLFWWKSYLGCAARLL